MQKAKLLEWHSKGLNAVFSKCLEQKGCPGQQAENKNSAHTLCCYTGCILPFNNGWWIKWTIATAVSTPIWETQQHVQVLQS